MQKTHDPYAVLRLRDYRCLLAGGVISSIGGEIQALAVGWELYQRTDSAAALGWAGLAQFLPVLLFSLPAGHLADRISRKLQFQCGQGVMMLASLGLVTLSIWQGPIVLVYVCLCLAGMGRAFSAPARSSLIPQIVPVELISNAITWNSSGWQIANVAGPGIGGLVLAVTGQVAPAYMLSIFCALTCVLFLVPIRPRPSTRSAEIPSLRSLLAGVEFVWQSKILLAAITLDLFAVLLGGATALLPIFARDILEVGPQELGLLRAAPAVGAFFMAVALAHRPPFRSAGRTLLLAVAGFGAATMVFGLSKNFWLSLAMLALTGALDNISVVIRSTLVQVVTPDSRRGRVAAVNLVFISSSNELGAFESGMTAAWFNPVISVVGGGIGTILVVLLVRVCWPQLAALRTIHELVKSTTSEKSLSHSNPTS